MILVNNKKHTIIDKGYGVFNYNKYKVFEFCNIIQEKDEVKHPTFKKEILKLYNL
tara:strand:+ start:352 stop:516 length:165 start_codon:yes stop_codon:yes gene_type:complete